MLYIFTEVVSTMTGNSQSEVGCGLPKPPVDIILAAAVTRLGRLMFKLYLHYFFKNYNLLLHI